MASRKKNRKWKSTGRKRWKSTGKKRTKGYAELARALESLKKDLRSCARAAGKTKKSRAKHFGTGEHIKLGSREHQKAKEQAAYAKLFGQDPGRRKGKKGKKGKKLTKAQRTAKMKAGLARYHRYMKAAKRKGFSARAAKASWKRGMRNLKQAERVRKGRGKLSMGDPGRRRRHSGKGRKRARTNRRRSRRDWF